MKEDVKKELRAALAMVDEGSIGWHRRRDRLGKAIDSAIKVISFLESELADRGAKIDKLARQGDQDES